MGWERSLTMWKMLLLLFFNAELDIKNGMSNIGNITIITVFHTLFGGKKNGLVDYVSGDLYGLTR